MVLTPMLGLDHSFHYIPKEKFNMLKIYKKSKKLKVVPVINNNLYLMCLIKYFEPLMVTKKK